MPTSILLTGCNRGVGLTLIRLLTRNNQFDNIIATCRNIGDAEVLMKIKNENTNVHILEIDVTHFDKYNTFSQQVANIVKDDGLNVLINNAGVSTKFTRLNYTKVEQLLDNFKTNTVAPIMLTKALAPFLQKGAHNTRGHSLVVNISSILGSIESNDTGGFYPYRCSKAALNAATKSMSVDLKKDGIIAVSVHPGWLKTDMGGEGAPLETEIGASGIIKLLSTLTPDDSGRFIQYDGQILPW